jgi:threonine/homoserine/homoserine lactone efflux protein
MEYLVSLMAFTFVAGITPGPNNIMLFASGLNHGVKKSLPHYFGVCIGFMFLVAAIGFGLGAIFKHSPFLHQILKILGAIYLVYLAWKIASASTESNRGVIRNPFTFIEAALFQWVNPKGWVISIGAIATFTIPSNIIGSIAAIIIMYFIMGLLTMGVWLTLGATLQRFLNSGKRKRIFNISMAILLILSIIPMVIGPVS